jgi:hypothetical protein
LSAKNVALSTSNTSVGYLITKMYDGLFEKLPFFEQMEEQFIVDIFMTSEVNLSEFEKF